MNKKLTRSVSDRMLCGVCGGIAEYLDVDPTIIRVAYVVMSLFSVAFPGLILYIILALIIPQKSY
jgi:phage shock protein C